MIGTVDRLRTKSQGAFCEGANGTRFCLWAPGKAKVRLVLRQEGQRSERNMVATGDGFFEWSESTRRDGLRYAYLLDDDPRELPDPATRWQPDGVNRPSALFIPDLIAWSDQRWTGVEPSDLVIYELHVGTFTPQGTFAAVIDRLPALAELGVTAIEIMPVAQFSGARNWGYDGVHPYAAQSTYGGPRDLQSLVDAAHRHGLAVFLDVVYNHLGPEGNYLAEFGPYFTDRYHTPWGQALNYDGRDSDAVRKFVLDNACQWVRDYHIDGLRLDAVQTIYDCSAKHILAEVQEEVQRLAGELKRRVIVIAETDQNDVRLVAPRAAGGYGLDGVWADEFHHSVHALLTGEREGYYEDFGEVPHLAKAIESVFVYDGNYSRHRRRRHGNRVENTPRSHFVTCLQNHDQVGNRARGDRLSTLVTPAQLRLAAGLLLTVPMTPLLFMGEEYGETNPFPFFSSFSDPGLIEAVRSGRKAEFASLNFRWQGEIPDPHAESTFASARLSWDWTEQPERQALRRLYQDLLAVRRKGTTQKGRPPAQVTQSTSAGNPCLGIRLGEDPTALVWVNLGAKPCPSPFAVPEGGRVVLSTEDVRYGGSRAASDLSSASATQLLPYELLCWGRNV